MAGNWLVTGGCGFIGVNLVKALHAGGAAVRVLDDLSAGSRDNLAAVAPFEEADRKCRLRQDTVELLVGDVRDPVAAGRALDGVDTVVHLAAQTGVIPSVENPRNDCDQNVMGTLNMLLAAREARAKCFVQASSGAPLGEQDPPVHEGKVPRPLSPYGASKLACEAYCSAFHASYGLNTVALRFSNAYGPWSFRKGSVVALFFRRAMAGEPLVIYGDGRQTRDFVHTEDLCQAVIRAAGADAGGEVFQIGTGRETAVNDLAEKIKKLVARDLRKKVEVVNLPARKGEITRSVCDIAKAKKKLGYKPRVALADGLAVTWEWFRSV